MLLRFDLLHIMIDEANEVGDSRIAKHIVNVHRTMAQEHPAKYSMRQLQRYIRYARSFKPTITPEVGSATEFSTHCTFKPGKTLRDPNAL